MRVALSDGVLFQELPFGGVLLDRRKLAVHRLSQRAAGVLRRALRGEHTVSPYESVLPTPETTDELRDSVLRALAQRGLVRGDV
ncbi:actinodefensin-associated protein B [Saccharothrix isguenensis]